MTAFTTTPTLANLPASDSRSRVSEFMKSLQDEICRGLEEVDGQAKFIEDSWQRPEGGGGRSRVLREGAIFEQAGVNFSEVWGKELPPSIAKQRPEAAGHQFYATGTSMVLQAGRSRSPARAACVEWIIRAGFRRRLEDRVGSR